MSKANIAIIWTLLFEWYVIRCACKNGHKKEIILSKEIWTICSNMLTNMGSMVNMIGRDLYDYLMSSRTFILITNKIIIRAPNIMR